jgi:hypothetical protein
MPQRQKPSTPEGVGHLNTDLRQDQKAWCTPLYGLAVYPLGKRNTAMRNRLHCELNL